jgi:hypothetical protein
MNANVSKQREMPFVQVLPPMRFLDEDDIARCKTFPQAFWLAQSQSNRGFTQDAIASHIGVDNGTMSRIIKKPKNRPAYLREDAFKDLCELFGNVGLIQWLAAQVNCKVVPATESRAERLRRELAEIEGQEQRVA